MAGQQRNSYGFTGAPQWPLAPQQGANWGNDAMAFGGGNYPVPNLPTGNWPTAPNYGGLPNVNPNVNNGQFGPMQYMLGQLGQLQGGNWTNADWRGGTKSWLENAMFPAIQSIQNMQQGQYERELGNFNATQQAYMNQANIAAMRMQQERENAALKQGALQWGQEFGEAQRQTNMADALQRWQLEQQLGWNQRELSQQLGFSREQLQAQTRTAAQQRQMEQLMQQRQLGFSREQLLSGEQQAEQQRQLERQMQWRQLGFGREQMQEQGRQAQLQRQLENRMQQRQLGFSQQELQEQSRQMGLQRQLERQMQQQQLGFSRQELQSQNRQQRAQRQLQRQMQGREIGQQRWQTGQELGFRREELGAQTQMAAEQRRLEQRMQGRQIRSTEALAGQQAELERERMRSQEEQSRWSQFGRAQAPSTQWARRW